MIEFSGTRRRHFPADDVKTDTIRSWHINERGWRDIGYHYVIELDGSVHEARPLSEVGAHAEGHNEGSVAIVYVGGLDEHGHPADTRTPAQKAALYALTEKLVNEYGATVHGHNEVSSKACPSFAVKSDWEAYLAARKGAVKKEGGSSQLSGLVVPSMRFRGSSEAKFPTLRNGVWGQPVVLIQNLLRAQTVDGIFGEKTERLVKEFQKNNEEKTDGIVGPRTWRALSYERKTQ